MIIVVTTIRAVASASTDACRRLFYTQTVSSFNRRLPVSNSSAGRNLITARQAFLDIENVVLLIGYVQEIPFAIFATGNMISLINPIDALLGIS